jgi:PhzF family phenazine biosynthesis protein
VPLNPLQKIINNMSPIKLPYTVLDVFTQRPWSQGNPLAVVQLSKENAKLISQEQKQLIAREFNFSETTFVHIYDLNANGKGDSTDRTLRFDIFTKTMEVPFAGHPTIGTAKFCFTQLFPSGTQKGTLISKAGDISVEKYPETGLIGAEIPAHNFRVHSSGPGKIENKDIIKKHPELEAVSAELENGFAVISIAKGL